MEEVICLDFQEHVLLARVRNTQPRGERFAIGAERICTFAKEDFGGGLPTFETLRSPLAEKGWLLEVTVPDPEPVASSPERAVPVSQQQVVPDAPKQVAPNLRLIVPVSATPFSSLRLPLALAATMILLISAGALFMKLRPRHAVPQVARPNGVERAASPATEPLKVEPESPPPNMSGAAVPASAQKTVSAIHHVKINVLDTSWLSASSDGNALLGPGRMYRKNDAFEFDFSKSSFLHLGNSYGVQATLDGKAISLPELRGAARVLQLTPSGSRLLPWTNDDPAPSDK